MRNVNHNRQIIPHHTYFQSSTKRLIQSHFSFTYTQDGQHVNELILRYSYDKNDVIIDLKLNHNLVPHNHFMRYQLPNGSDAVQHFTKTDVDLCHYKVSRLEL